MLFRSAEGYLRSGAGIHGVEVVNEGFHDLKRGLIGGFDGGADSKVVGRPRRLGADGLIAAPGLMRREKFHQTARLGHVQDEDALAPDVTGLDIGRYVDRLMNAPAEPVGAQLGSEDDAGSVLDA